MVYREVLVLGILASIFSLSPVLAYTYGADTTLDVNGTVDDASEDIRQSGQEFSDDYYYSSNSREVDETLTSGGKLTSNREFSTEATDKLVTFQANGSGHMVSNNEYSYAWDDPYRFGGGSYQGQAIFNNSGTVEYFDGGFSVKPVSGDASTYALVKSDYRTFQSDPSYHTETYWGYTYDMIDEPGNYSQMLEQRDRTKFSGDVKNFQKKFSYDYYYPRYLIFETE